MNRLSVLFLSVIAMTSCGGGGTSPLSLDLPSSASAFGASRPLDAFSAGHSLVRTRYKSLYSFTGSPDGEGPVASLTDVNGSLYGTTCCGGAYGYGTVFEITTSGSESVLYSFKGKPDGASANASLTAVNGVLYGTTSYGGQNEMGTVFKVRTSGMEHVLHSFEGSPNDGEYSYAGLLAVNGTLYGTTQYGGKIGAGTVFSITPSGVENVLYGFKGQPDGAWPLARLIALKGELYGTTAYGGASSGPCNQFGPPYGCGTVFKVGTSPSESDKVLYSFKGEAKSDGQMPEAGLLAVNRVLYGTTYSGGAMCYSSSATCGTVFRVSR